MLRQDKKKRTNIKGNTSIHLYLQSLIKLFNPQIFIIHQTQQAVTVASRKNQRQILLLLITTGSGSGSGNTGGGYNIVQP